MYAGSANTGFSAIRGAEGAEEEKTGSEVAVCGGLAADALRPGFLLREDLLVAIVYPF